MRNIVKWPGGKYREFPKYQPYLPDNVRNYIEPFVGGGGAAIRNTAELRPERMILNDFSSDLMNTYKGLSRMGVLFHDYILKYDAIKNQINSINDDELTEDIFTQRTTARIREINILDDYLLEYARSQFIRRSARYGFDQRSLADTVRDSLHAGHYALVRKIYNECKDEPKKSALFFYLRELSYASIFRFNSKGEFNTPYGGASYNDKSINSKVKEIINSEFLRDAELYNEDFEDFINSLELTNDDFIYLDPPYVTPFSSYDDKSFGLLDQERLANLLMQTEARFMVVINDCDEVRELYNWEGLNFNTYAKRYNVNIQNRNDQGTVHVVIRNYE